jgi:hypothetical protein
MECAEKAPRLQKPQEWATRLQLQSRETDLAPDFDLAMGMLLE